MFIRLEFDLPASVQSPLSNCMNYKHTRGLSVTVRRLVTFRLSGVSVGQWDERGS